MEAAAGQWSAAPAEAVVEINGLVCSFCAFGAEKSVVGGEGKFDPAQACGGHGVQTAADRFADQKCPHQNHRPDGDTHQSADMAPRVKPE